MDSGLPHRVWVAETNDRLRELLVRTLDRWSATVCERDYRTGQAAIADLQLCPHPDIVMLDLGPPDQEDISLLARIRAIAPDIRIIVLPLDDTFSTLSSAAAGLYDGCHLKTGTIDDLKNTITRTLASEGATQRRNPSQDLGTGAESRLPVSFPKPMKHRLGGLAQRT